MALSQATGLRSRRGRCCPRGTRPLWPMILSQLTVSLAAQKQVHGDRIGKARNRSNVSYITAHGSRVRGRQRLEASAEAEQLQKAAAQELGGRDDGHRAACSL